MKFLQSLLAGSGLVLVAVGAANVRRAQPPGLAIEPEVQSFGTARVGEVLMLTYRVKNTGDAPVRLLGSPAMCNMQACLTLTGFPITVAPRGSVDLALEFQAKGACDYLGSKTVYTDCPGLAEIGLVAQGRIEGESPGSAGAVAER